MEASVRTEPLECGLGASVLELQLGQPLGLVAASLRDALARSRLLVLRGQSLSHQQLLEAARVFGEPEVYLNGRHSVPGFPMITAISNIFVGGAPIGMYDGDNEEEWHSDLSWRRDIGRVTLLYSVVAPRLGGETRFADTTAAFAALPANMQRLLCQLEAVHSMEQLSRRQTESFTSGRPEATEALPSPEYLPPDVVQPLVLRHPKTGRLSLLLGDAVIKGIVGLSTSESADLLRWLHAFATQNEFLYSHKWEAGDVIIWDNTALMHTASPCDSARNHRLLYRTAIAESGVLP